MRLQLPNGHWLRLWLRILQELSSQILLLALRQKMSELQREEREEREGCWVGIGRAARRGGRMHHRRRHRWFIVRRAARQVRRVGGHRRGALRGGGRRAQLPPRRVRVRLGTQLLLGPLQPARGVYQRLAPGRARRRPSSAPIRTTTRLIRAAPSTLIRLFHRSPPRYYE